MNLSKVLFCCCSRSSTNLLRNIQSFIYKIRMSTLDHNVAKQSLYTEEMLGKTFSQRIKISCLQQSIYIHCFSEYTPFSFDCGSHITGQTLTLGWRYSLYGSLFRKSKMSTSSIVHLQKYFIYSILTSIIVELSNTNATYSERTCCLTTLSR